MMPSHVYWVLNHDIANKPIRIQERSLANWCQFFMGLSNYWSWISSSHCQSSCGSADYFDYVMTKFMTNNKTDAFNSLTRRMNFKFMSVGILTIKISQWARVNFCSYRKMCIRRYLTRPDWIMMPSHVYWVLNHAISNTTNQYTGTQLYIRRY